MYQEEKLHCLLIRFILHTRVWEDKILEQYILALAPVHHHHQKADSCPLGGDDTPTDKDDMEEVPLVPEPLVSHTPHTVLSEITQLLFTCLTTSNNSDPAHYINH